MVQRRRSARIGASEFTFLPQKSRGPLGLGAALAMGSAACALALFAPSPAWAACSTPNNVNCDVDSTTWWGDFENGVSAAGTVNVLSGVTLNTLAPSVFYNGNFDADLSAYSMGTLNVLSGAYFNNNFTFINGSEATGVVNVGGSFDNRSGTTFINGDNGAGTLTVQNGGVFNNAGQFYNGDSGEGSGSVVIQSGGEFRNTSSGQISQSNGSISNAGTFENLGALNGGTVTNEAGGEFVHYAGNQIGNFSSVGFTNHGTFNIGLGNLATTTLNGSYTQSSSGTLAIRADFATATSDRLVVNGPVTVAGKVDVSLMNFNSASTFQTFYGVVTSTTDLITDNGLTTNEDTAVVAYRLQRRTDDGSDNIDLQIYVDFQGIDGGLTPNQNSVGGGLNDALDSGATLAFMPALFELGTTAELANALDQLAPAGVGATTASMMQSGTTFAEQLLSCRTLGEGDANAIIREGQCLWARGTIRHASYENGGRTYGAKETAPFYSAGAQFNLGGAWRMGGGIGYETTDLDTYTGGTDTDRLHLGAVLKYNPGPLLLAATVTGAFGWSDSVRHVNIDDFSATAHGTYESDLISGRLTAAYLLPFQRFYLKPQVDVAYMHVSRDGYREHGDGDIALSVGSSSDGVWSVIPMLELGTEVALTSGGVARPFLRGGVTWRDKDSFVTSSTFIGAPDGAPFSVTSQIDDVTANIAAGLDLIAPSDTTLRLQYDGQFGDTVQQHVGSAKLSVKY